MLSVRVRPNGQTGVSVGDDIQIYVGQASRGQVQLLIHSPRHKYQITRIDAEGNKIQAKGTSKIEVIAEGMDSKDTTGSDTGYT